MESLNALFIAYANYGTRATASDLDGAKFVKIFKDCGLVGSGLSTTDLDIIYSKVFTPLLSMMKQFCERQPAHQQLLCARDKNRPALWDQLRDPYVSNLINLIADASVSLVTGQDEGCKEDYFW